MKTFNYNGKKYKGSFDDVSNAHEIAVCEQNCVIDLDEYIETYCTEVKTRTIDKIITKVNTRFGSPMGRPNVGEVPILVTSGKDCKIVAKNQVKIFDCKVPMTSDGAYDKGGAYWGIGRELRVRYTKDLSYIEFYRV